MAGGLCLGTAGAAGASSHSARPADEPARTGAGHSFIVPSGWTLTRSGRSMILEAPEKGSRVALVDAGAANADSAVTEAWESYRSGMKPDLLMSMPSANRNGWQDVRTYVYRTPPNGSRLLTARAMRHGGRWAVRIDDLSSEVNGKRSAELALIREEFLPAGHIRESFAGRKANRLGPARIDALRTFIEESRRKLGVPGISVGLVQDGKILLAEGFGVRELGKPDPVDSDTLYLIASNTKPR